MWIYMPYELIGIIYVTKSAVQTTMMLRWQQQQCSLITLAKLAIGQINHNYWDSVQKADIKVSSD